MAGSGNSNLQRAKDAKQDEFYTQLKVVIDKVSDLTGNGAIDLEDIQIILKTPGIVQTLNGDGDFRSEECVELLKEADIVVTIIFSEFDMGSLGIYCTDYCLMCA